MFSGIGGICLGFKLAGADLVWANDIDPYACKTYRHNFGSGFLMEGDIREIDLNSIPDFDILTAGFPCQPFSIMGNQKGFADPRGTMYYEILRVIDKIRPQIILLENVKNLVEHDKGLTFITIYHTLAERGYGMKYSVQGAHTHANIPQYRDRIFTAAFLDFDKLERFSFPSEIPLAKKINDIIDRNRIVDEKYYYNTTSKYYEKLNSRMTDNSAIYRIDDSGIAKRAWRICPTLKANMGTYHDRVPLTRDVGGIRKLTPAECLVLQGFPSKYSFPEIPIREMYKQLGNTVCVPVVFRIARRLMAIMGKSGIENRIKV
jgi:DNA (cytosine-5)-methyltransferase 1